MSNIIGVIGQGESTRQNTTAVFKDFHACTPIDRVVAPGSSDIFTPAVRNAVDWAHKHKVPYVLMVAPGDDLSHLDDYDPSTRLETNDPMRSTVQDCDQLFLAWSDTDTASTERAEHALKAGKKVFDLTNGLYPLALGEDAPADNLSPPNPEVSSPVAEAILTPEAAVQLQDGAILIHLLDASADEAQQVEPGLVSLTYSDLDKTFAELAAKITADIVPVVIKDVCHALAAVLDNVKV